MDKYQPVHREYYLIGQCLCSYNDLLLRSFQVELDSYLGCSLFKTYVRSIQLLMETLSIPFANRHFRDSYSGVYQDLYTDGGAGFLPEIFDAAQQNYQCVWVNGDAYSIGAYTLILAEQLVEAYYRLFQYLKVAFMFIKYHPSPLEEPARAALCEKLTYFDSSWINYEQAYISELMRIEYLSKQKIVYLVRVEIELEQFEADSRLQGRIFMGGNYYDRLRRKVCQSLATINSVANVNGKGRDDLSYDILQAAYSLLNRVSSSQSRAVRLAAERIRGSFLELRSILHSYCYTTFNKMDAQLKNNSKLVEALAEYEHSWEKGKRYFLDHGKELQILAFSAVVYAARAKYPAFCEMLECSDPAVFGVVAGLVVLRSLEGEDEGITVSYLKQLDEIQCKNYESLKLRYDVFCGSFPKGHHHPYNYIEEALVLATENPYGLCYSVQAIVRDIKETAISIERSNPSEWNEMLSVLLSDEVEEEPKSVPCSGGGYSSESARTLDSNSSSSLGNARYETESTGYHIYLELPWAISHGNHSAESWQ